MDTNTTENFQGPHHTVSSLYAKLAGALPLSPEVVLLVLVVGLALKLMPEKAAGPPQGAKRERKYGQWAHSVFVTPIPKAYPHWDYQKTKPLPYRAFKHKYSITMGIRNMEWDSWIELDSEWAKYHQAKLQRVEERGTELYETSPRASAAAYELLDEFRRYLPSRYPTLFQQTATGLHNLVTGESFDFTPSAAEDPILIAAKLVQDDLAIMVEDEHGNYSLESGAIILAGFWRFRDKFQMSLNQIHTSGDVPQYNEKLKTGMGRFFTKLACDKPVVRNNYFIQTDDNLGWSHSIGAEDSDSVGWNTAAPASQVDQLYFRSERQSLRRLPKTGAIVFTIRTYFVPMAKLCQEPYIPRRLLNGISTWTGDVEEYKGYSKYAEVLLPYLEAKAAEQEQAGLVAESGPEVYPF